MAELFNMGFASELPPDDFGGGYGQKDFTPIQWEGPPNIRCGRCGHPSRIEYQQDGVIQVNVWCESCNGPEPNNWLIESLVERIKREGDGENGGKRD